MPKFVFPDSGIEIEIERVSYVVSRMVEAALQESYPDKPIAPFKEIKDVDGVVLQKVDMPLDTKFYLEQLSKPNVREEDKKAYQSDLDIVNAYLKSKREWDTRVSDAYSRKMRVQYAKHIKSPIDTKAVNQIVAESKELGLDLESDILKEYADANVPIEPEVLPKWIYLWCICAQSVADISALNTWMQTGSKEALQATRNALSMF